MDLTGFFFFELDAAGLSCIFPEPCGEGRRDRSHGGVGLQSQLRIPVPPQKRPSGAVFPAHCRMDQGADTEHKAPRHNGRILPLRNPSVFWRSLPAQPSQTQLSSRTPAGGSSTSTRMSPCGRSPPHRMSPCGRSPPHRMSPCGRSPPHQRLPDATGPPAAERHIRSNRRSYGSPYSSS